MEFHPASQIILYAKGHFKRGELFKDLKILVGDYVDSPPDGVTYGDILSVLCDTALPFLLAGSNPTEYLKGRLLSLARGDATGYGTPTELVAQENANLLNLSTTRQD